MTGTLLSLLLRRASVVAALAALGFSFASARAGADDLAASETEAQTEAELETESDDGGDIYERVALPPFLERGVQAILEDQWRQAQEHAQKLGVRRMSRKRFRRELVALDRSTDQRIRALIGVKRFAAWDRARAAEDVPGRPRTAGRARVRWPRDRCASLTRLLRGAALATTTAEAAHVWIHNHARHC